MKGYLYICLIETLLCMTLSIMTIIITIVEPSTPRILWSIVLTIASTVSIRHLVDYGNDW